LNLEGGLTQGLAERLERRVIHVGPRCGERDALVLQ
jgi:hypothetical protein